MQNEKENWGEPKANGVRNFSNVSLRSHSRMESIARFQSGLITELAPLKSQRSSCAHMWGGYPHSEQALNSPFYQHLRELRKLALYDGVETPRHMEELGLQKNPVKRELSWNTHAIDAIAIGCAELKCENPYRPEFRVWKRLEYAKRQLYRLEPDKGGVRRRYGGSWSTPPFRKGDVVLWHGRLARVRVSWMVKSLYTLSG
jgi:hypothetical protein